MNNENVMKFYQAMYGLPDIPLKKDFWRLKGHMYWRDELINKLDSC